jgi:hypothetical protein
MIAPSTFGLVGSIVLAVLVVFDRDKPKGRLKNPNNLPVSIDTSDPASDSNENLGRTKASSELFECWLDRLKIFLTISSIKKGEIRRYVVSFDGSSRNIPLPRLGFRQSE